jgi:hypothetical protein
LSPTGKSNCRRSPGDLSIDASGLQVVDILAESIRRMSKLHDGYGKAVDNLLRLKPEEVERAGLNQSQIDRLGTLKVENDRIEKLQPAAEKLVDILRDTGAMRRHEMAIIIGEQAAQARRRADHSSARSQILGPLNDLLDYQFGPAQKGAATRVRNAAEDEDPTEDEK